MILEILLINICVEGCEHFPQISLTIFQKHTKLDCPFMVCVTSPAGGGGGGLGDVVVVVGGGGGGDGVTPGVQMLQRRLHLVLRSRFPPQWLRLGSRLLRLFR